MANTIQHKRSSVAGNTPTSAQIAVGELAVNFADKKLFTKDASNTVFNLASRWSDETGGISRSDLVKVGAAGVPASALDVAGTISHPATATTGAMDLAVSDRFTITPTANTTFSFANAPASRAAEVVLRITNGGSFTMTWPGSVTWLAGSAPALKSAGSDVITFWTHNGGTTWLADVAATGGSSAAAQPTVADITSAAGFACGDSGSMSIFLTSAGSTSTNLTPRFSINNGTTFTAVTAFSWSFPTSSTGFLVKLDWYRNATTGATSVWGLSSNGTAAEIRYDVTGNTFSAGSSVNKIRFTSTQTIVAVSGFVSG